MIFTLCCLAMMVATARAEPPSQRSPRVVDELDLSRYAGRWYEISHIPNRFQRGCESNTTAEYTLQEDGRIEVINRCRKENGKIMEARGVARMASGANPARLEVSFVSILGKHLFWGDYWVIGLGEDYQWAIVGHPQRKYGWILAREPSLDDATLAHIVARLKEAGYDPQDFQFTKQDASR